MPKPNLPGIKRGNNANGLSELNLIQLGRRRAKRRSGNVGNVALGPTRETLVAIEEIEARLLRQEMLEPINQKIAELEEQAAQLVQDIEFQQSKLLDAPGQTAATTFPSLAPSPS